MDILRRAITKDGLVRISAINGTNLLQESLQRTKSLPPSMIHLGQGLLGSLLLLSVTTKSEDAKISLQWNTPTGPFGSMYVEANAKGEVRGTILKPQASVTDLKTLLGEGHLQVTRQEVKGQVGVVSCEGDVCSDLLNYLHQSEQRRVAMNLWVDLDVDEANEVHPFKVKKALGYLIELLPDDNVIEQKSREFYFEERLKELGGLSAWDIDYNDPTKSILQILSDEEKPKETMYQSLRFHCNCTEERAARALALAEAQSPTEDFMNKEEDVTCEFCGQTYHIHLGQTSEEA